MTASLIKRPVIFGEVLFDHFPDGSVVLGGAPFNVAWNLQAFGQAPLLVSRVGQDELGARINDVMASWSMDASALQSDPVHPTGAVDVSFNNGEPEYDIVVDSAYDFIEPADIPALKHAAILYHGSLATRNETARATLKRIVSKTSAPRFIDVNLRAPWWRKQDVLNLMEGASWVKLNESELAELAPAAIAPDDPGNHLRDRYGVDTLILTRGSAGAELYAPQTSFNVAPKQASQVTDTVGAGDAFASTVILGLLQKWPLPDTLERAQAFASAVVGLRGATTTDRAFYDAFSSAWDIHGPE